ncbi:MAG: glycosyl transferase [Bradyrhizobium sp.]|uniref:glycosyl transferase n=1 Tax=Bradyrhizobium sp. TaxID=376 RepID=UPI001D4A2F2E|nr:glycosyl transferase [Bradyrhizobium sp.]MBV9563236.1 glycosyl transferase [Bradyrhizobium sp.]
MTAAPLPVILLALLVAAALTYGITWVIRPLLQRYALARPNARSSHRIPTPQGGGIAVIAATLAVSAACAALLGFAIPPMLFAATLFVALVGFVDDIKSIPVLPRLLLQGLAVGAVIFGAPEELRLVEAVPLVVERGLLLVAGLWFVNLVNFMDGLDLLTVSEAVPVTAAVVIAGWLGEVPLPATIVAAALCGAMLGFAPLNRPVAKVFLGDVGSLPIGLLLGWCLLQLAFAHHLAAALLLPLYYLADATLTLVRRVARREPFWAAHRTHFYQRATDNGYTVWGVVRAVFLLNVALAVLAMIAVVGGSMLLNVLLLVAGAAAVTVLLARFSRKPLR